MTSADPTSFFALLAEPISAVHRIRLAQPVQRSLASRFREGASRLWEGLEEVRFEGRYKPEEDQVLTIPDFPIPAEVWKALESPAECEDFRPDADDPPRVKAIFTGSPGTGTEHSGGWVIFQRFQRSQFLTRRGFTVILDGKTFRRLEEPTLSISDEITACYRDGTVFFTSYPATRQFLDLTRYYREATDRDIEMLATSGHFYCEDIAALKTSADSIVRSKLALLLDGGFLERVQPRRVAECARKYDVPCDLRLAPGEKPTVVLPVERRALKDLLKLLDEDFYSGPLTDTRFVSSSKRRLG